MKKRSLLLTLAIVLLPCFLFPQGFNYQGVVRNSEGSVISGQHVNFSFSILNSESAAVYTETHTAATGPLGLVELVIGTGSVVSGSFSGIDWSAGGYSLKVEMDPSGGTNYTLSETRALQWVPYAKHSEKTAGIAGGKLEIMGDASQNDEEALFEVKRNDGQTVFAVYPDGVRVYVEDPPGKGSKGGFAVGGFDPTKGLTSEFLRVTPDSVRIYIEAERNKGPKGGFAVGGFDPVKGLTNDYFNVSGKSDAETYAGEPRILWYPLKEAFLAGNVLVEHPDSVGTNSWASGYQSKAIGNFSQALGYQTIARGFNSTSIGFQTISTGVHSMAIGYNSRSPGGGSYAFGVGSISKGMNSMAMGYYSNANGDYSMATGFETTANGRISSVYGYRTVSHSGYETVIGSYNTTYEPYSWLWDWRDRLFVIGNGIDENSRSNALTILKNGCVGLQSVENPLYALELPNSITAAVGQARANSWATYSDGRAKTERNTLPYGLREVMQLEPQSYYHHNTSGNGRGIEILTKGAYDIGLVAQEVYPIIPEAVNKPEDESKDLWSMSYNKLVPVLVKAIQEQQEIIDNQQSQINELKSLVYKMAEK